MNQVLHTFDQRLLKESLSTLIMWHQLREKSHHLVLVRLVNHLEMKLPQEILFLEPVSLNRWRWSFLLCQEPMKSGISTGSIPD